MAPAAKFIFCHRPGCSGSCPAHVVLSSQLPNAKRKAPVCRVCSTAYRKQPKAAIQEWESRAASKAAIVKQVAAGKGQNNQNKELRTDQYKEMARQVDQLRQQLAEAERKIANQQPQPEAGGQDVGSLGTEVPAPLGCERKDCESHRQNSEP